MSPVLAERPEGADYQWRKIPLGELSIDPLEAEILILRHQLNVLQQRTPRRRLHLRWIDRALFIIVATLAFLMP